MYILSKEDDWLLNLNNAKKYMDINKKRPSKHSTYKDIRYLGKWITEQSGYYLKNIHMLKVDELRKKWEEFIFDEKYKEYFISNEELWFKIFEELKQYINKNKKKPSIKDKNKDIQKLAAWICTQKVNYKTKKYIMQNENIRKEWDNFINSIKFKKYFVIKDIKIEV